MPECQRCGAPFAAVVATKRYCAERCRKADEESRRAARKPKAPRVRDACVDCGTPEGMGWWVGRMKHPGSAGPRCHPCYLAQERRKYAQKMGRPVRPRNPRPTPVALFCVGCNAELRGRSRNSYRRCPECTKKNRRSAEQRRREAITAGDSSITWRTVGEREGWRCHICAGAVPHVAGTATQPKGATVDHLIPIADGGAHEWHNVALAHRTCNIKRGTGGVAQLRLAA